MPSPAPSVRLSLPRWLWIVVVAGYLPVLGLLVVLVVLLEDSRQTTDGRLAVSVERLERATLPLATEVTPAARAANADRPAARRLSARTLELTRQVTPLARDLRVAQPGRQLQTIATLATDLSARDAGTQLQKAGALSDNLLSVNAGGQIRRSGQLADTLLGAGVGGAVGDVRRLSTLLASSNLPATARSVKATADELGRGTRLARLLERLTFVVGQAKALRTVPKVTVAADAVTGRIVPLIERGVAMLAETLTIVRETNRHAANLDRKLGGDLPLP